MDGSSAGNKGGALLTLINSLLASGALNDAVLNITQARNAQNQALVLQQAVLSEASSAAMVQALARLSAQHGLVRSYTDLSCSVGYEGNLCATCAAGYGSTGQASCVKCPPW
jgi:hypothetical protein